MIVAERPELVLSPVLFMTFVMIGRPVTEVNGVPRMKALVLYCPGARVADPRPRPLAAAFNQPKLSETLGQQMGSLATLTLPTCQPPCRRILHVYI
jgi:hypothetical protein